MYSSCCSSAGIHVNRRSGAKTRSRPPCFITLPALESRPVLCSSVPPIGRDSQDEAGRRQAGPGHSDGDRRRDGPDEEEAGDERERGENWGDDAFVSGDPAAIDRTWGHAVDFVVDAGFLEVRYEIGRYFGVSVCDNKGMVPLSVSQSVSLSVSLSVYRS